MKGGNVNINLIKERIIKTPTSTRFIEIDMLRGLAIFLMIFGHILWDLDYFGLFPMNYAVYSLLQKTVPPLFFLLVGISIIVNKKKAEEKPFFNENIYYKNLILRGLKVFSLGMILTIGSLIYIPEKAVIFGVLHCIGVSIILTALFLKFKTSALPFSLLILFSGTFISQFVFEKPTFFHLMVGLHQTNVWMYTIDYFPLIPWFGICLLGVVIGDFLYSGSKRRFHMPDLSKYKPVIIFQWLGKHSLIIYLVHQPIIGGVLLLFIWL
jgi:uncharacterized membrane protein